MNKQNRHEILLEQAKADSYYQTCLEEVKRWEAAYLALWDTLPEMQRRTVEGYISACEELDHALLALALKE